MRLSETNAPCRAVISEVHGKSAERLSAMGLTGGTEVAVLRRKRDGGTVILFRGTRIALGGDVGREVEVENVRENQR